MVKVEYTIVLEGSRGKGFSAFSPDVPGVVATGKTETVVRKRIASGIAWHIKLLKESGTELPRPQTKVYVEHVDVG
jgi:predicted RNase H-like HicB family nuclease